MSRLIYTLFLHLMTPLLLLSLFFRSIRAPHYRQRIAERFGFKPAEIGSDYLWLHSVSVGETVAARPLVEALLERYPHNRLLITTMTPTGSEQVRRSFGERVDHMYAPYDLPRSVNRFLENTRPIIAIIMETELWPNLLHHCNKRNIPVALLNARLSSRSAQGYALVPEISSTMLGHLSAVAAQNANDGARFVDLGLPPEKLSVSGSIKFDYSLEDDIVRRTAQLRREWQGASKRPVWIAASTHQGEDEIILEAHQQLLGRQLAALLILVPRHPERFADTYKLCKDAGLQISRRSLSEPVQADTQVVLGDTMGELAALYGACDIAFVGGSLVKRGGHNPIEPAAWGLPVLTGPYVFNFQEIVGLLEERGGLSRVESALDISERVASILTDSEAHARAGAANKAVVEENRGASMKQLHVLESLLL